MKVDVQIYRKGIKSDNSPMKLKRQLKTNALCKRIFRFRAIACDAISSNCK